jgi:glycosyltransferase involved in cell wall biosynthesis
MRILMLAHFAGSPGHGMVYGHYYLAREWVRLGHEVEIVSASFAHTRHRQPDCPGLSREERIDGIRYLWLKVPGYRPGGRIGRVANLLAFTARLALLPARPADLVILSCHHPLPIGPALRLARQAGAPLVFEVRDLWPLTLIELGGASPANPLIRLMQRAEDRAYRESDLTVSVLPEALGHMVEHGLDPGRFLYCPNGVDLSDESPGLGLPQGHRETLDRLKASGRFLVGYAGRIGLANALHSLIDAAAADPEVQAVFLGDGSHRAALEARAQRLGIAERATFLPAVDKDRVGDFLRRMDALYIGLQHQPLFRFGVSPTKLNDYLLVGKPVICAIDAPGTAVAESGAGICCGAEDPGAIASAIGQLRALPESELAAMGRRGQDWIRAHRDYRVLASRFLDGALAARRQGGRP